MEKSCCFLQSLVAYWSDARGKKKTKKHYKIKSRWWKGCVLTHGSLTSRHRKKNQSSIPPFVRKPFPGLESGNSLILWRLSFSTSQKRPTVQCWQNADYSSLHKERIKLKRAEPRWLNISSAQIDCTQTGEAGLWGWAFPVYSCKKWWVPEGAGFKPLH